MADFGYAPLGFHLVNIPSGLVPMGEYNNATDYAVGDSVSYQGSSYIMYVDAAAGTLPTDDTKWQLLSQGMSSINTGDQMVFKTISSAGADDIVADTITDTLNIAAGDGHLVITTNAGTDTLTLTVVTNIELLPTEVKFGSTTQEYDITGNTYITSVTDGGAPAMGIPDETSAGHKMADCISAVSTAMDGIYLVVREKTGAASDSNPLTIQFKFTGITAFNIIKTRCFYHGSTSHDIVIELWNGATWDIFNTFSGESEFKIHSLEVLNPATYIIGGVVLARYRHLQNGLANHHMDIDYFSLNDGGGGGGGGHTAAATSFAASGTIAATNVQTALEELDSEKKPVSLIIPAADLTISGSKTSEFEAGDSISVGALVVLDDTSHWIATDANATATSVGLLGISLETKTVGNAMSTALPGSFVRNDAWAWTPGATLYVSESTSAITATQPTTANVIIRVIGHAVTADVLFFNPSVDWITHS